MEQEVYSSCIKGDYMKSYSSHNTAILIVDPFNDFLSEGGKLWSKTKETVKGVNLIEKLKGILSAARSSGIKIVYVPHHQTEKGDYLDWKIKAPSHQHSSEYLLFEKGSWGGEFHSEVPITLLLKDCLKKEIIFKFKSLDRKWICKYKS